MSLKAAVKEFVYNQSSSKDDEKQKILVIRFVKAIGDSLTQILQEGGQAGQQIGAIREDKHEMNLGDSLYVYTQQEAEDKPLDLLKIPQGLEGDEAFRIGFAQRKLTVNITETTKRRKELRASEKTVSTPTPTTTTATPTPTSTVTTTTSSPRRASAKPPSTRTAIAPEPTTVSKVKLLEPKLGPVAITKTPASSAKGGPGSKRAPLKKRANLSLMGATGGKATGQLNAFRNRSLPPSKPTPTPTPPPKANSGEVQHTTPTTAPTAKESDQQSHPKEGNTPANVPQKHLPQNAKNASESDAQNIRKNFPQDANVGNVGSAKNQGNLDVQNASQNLVQEQQKKQSLNERNLGIQKYQSDLDRQSQGKHFQQQQQQKPDWIERNQQVGNSRYQQSQRLQNVGRIQSPSNLMQLENSQINKTLEQQKSLENQLGGFGSIVMPNSDSKTPENSDSQKNTVENSEFSNKGAKILLKKPPINIQNAPKNNNSNNFVNLTKNQQKPHQQQQQQQQVLNFESENNFNAQVNSNNNHNNNIIDDFVAPLIAKMPEEKKTSLQLKSSSARKLPSKPSPAAPDFNKLRSFLTAVDFKQFELAVLSMLFAAEQRGLSLQEIYEPLQMHYYSKYNIKYERLVLEDLLRKHSKYSHHNFRYTLTNESKLKFENEYLRDLCRGVIPKEFQQKSPVQQLSLATQSTQNHQHVENAKLTRENSVQKERQKNHQHVENAKQAREYSVQKEKAQIHLQEKQQFQQESPKTTILESSSQGEGQSSSQAAVKNSSKRQLFDQQQQQQQRSSGSADGQPPKKLKLVFKKDVSKQVLESGELPPTQYQDDRIMKNQVRRGVVSEGAIVHHESLIAGSDDSQPDQLSYESQAKKRRLDEVPRKEVEGSTAVVLPQLLLPDQHLYERYCSNSNLSAFIQPPAISSLEEFMQRRKKFAEEYDIYSELYRCFEKAKEILKQLKEDEKQSSIVEFMEKYEPYLEKIDDALCLLEKKLLPERSQLLCYYELSIKRNT